MGSGTGTAFFNGVALAQSVEIYNIAGNSWTLGTPVAQTAAAPGGGVAGGKLMVQGGTNTAGDINTVQVSLLGGICGNTFAHSKSGRPRLHRP